MSQSFPPFRILIVEDEALLVMDMEAMLEDAGHCIQGTAASLYAVEAMDGPAPDLAFVDVQLAHKTSGIDVARLIRARWPQAVVVFVTANPAVLPEDFAGAHGVIPKPFSREGFLGAIAYLEEGVRNPPPVMVAPASFAAAPRVAALWSTGSPHLP